MRYLSLAMTAALAFQAAAATTEELAAKISPWDGRSGGIETQLRQATAAAVAPDAPAGARAEHEAILLKAYAENENLQARLHFIRELELVGGAPTAAALKEALTDPARCGDAVRTVQTIHQAGEPSAAAAVQEAYLRSPQTCLVALTHGLGRLDAVAPEVQAALLKQCDAEDAAIAREALRTLARLGIAEGAKPLAAAAAQAEGYARKTTRALSLTLAERLTEKGQGKQAADVCRAVLAALEADDGHLAARALHALANADPDGSGTDLLAALDHADRIVRDAAARLLNENQAQGVTDLLVSRTKLEDPVARAGAIAILARRLGAKAAPQVAALIDDQNADVQAAAMRAAALSPSPAVVDRLLARLESDSAAATQALVAMEADFVSEQLGKRLAAAPTADEKVALLEMLAARRAHGQIDAALAAAGDDDRSVRKAAIKALADLAQPKDLAGLLARFDATESRAERRSLQNALVAAAQGIEDPEAQAKPFVAALAGKPSDRQAELLQALGRLGSAPALEAVGKSLTAEDDELRTDAVRVLAAWPNVRAVPKLVDVLATDASKKRRTLAFRALAEVVDTAIGDKVTPPVSAVDAGRLLAAADKLAGLAPEDQVDALLANVLNRALFCKTSGPGHHALLTDGSVAQYWAVERTPTSVQFDLGETIDVGLVHVVFYADDERYYQYFIETSLDGESWTTVVDQKSRTTNVSKEGEVHPIPTTKARHLRLTITRNSANPAVHARELRVYAAGAVPPGLAILSDAPTKSTASTPTAASADTTETAAPFVVEDGFTSLFNGKDFTGWRGATRSYRVVDGKIVLPKGGGGVLHTAKQYDNFVLRFEFLLTPGANNGLGIRYPGRGDAAYTGMELQILDNTADKYKDLKPYQFHGSIYTIAPAKRGFLKPVGEWNQQEVIADGSQIKVTLNGTVILDFDLASSDAAQKHAGARRKSGYIGFLGHRDHVEFRNIRIKPIVRILDPAVYGIAVGKPATAKSSELPHTTPNLVVDGNTNNDSAWWASPPHPQWWQVDLEEPHKIGRIHVFPYHDDKRYYQYYVEISTDGKSWTEVVDMRKNTSPSTADGHNHQIDPIDARYVRVQMLANSANPGVHLTEVRIFPASL